MPLPPNTGRAFSADGRGKRESADTYQLSVRIVGGSVPTGIQRASEVA
jgi:hypothetical protein